jgi:hypothetical protein
VCSVESVADGRWVPFAAALGGGDAVGVEGVGDRGQAFASCSRRRIRSIRWGAIVGGRPSRTPWARLRASEIRRRSKWATVASRLGGYGVLTGHRHLAKKVAHTAPARQRPKMSLGPSSALASRAIRPRIGTGSTVSSPSERFSGTSILKPLLQRLKAEAQRRHGREATEAQHAVASDGSRDAFRAALGVPFLADNDRLLAELRRRSKAPRRDGIRLHPRNAIHDLQVGWWQTPDVRAFAETAIALDGLDLRSRKVIGGEGRVLVRRADEALRAIDEFWRFLGAFDPDSVPGSLGEILHQYALMARWQFISLTNEDRAQAEVAAEQSAIAADRAAQIQRRLDEMKTIEEGPPLAAEDIIEFAVGQRPSRGTEHHGQLMGSFGDDPQELAQLAAAQLRHLVAADELPESVAATWLAQACSLLLQAHPLLAHRAAHLALQSFRAAAAENATAVAGLLRRFHHTEVGRITSRAHQADELIREFHENDEDEALVRAYTTLVEGPLRSYASALLDVWRVENGLQVPETSTRPMLGELEDSLRASGRELARLLTLGISRGVRNAVAHENVVRTATGELGIVQPDGSFTSIELQTIYGDFATLRSALLGLDVGFGIAQWLFGDTTDFDPRTIHATSRSLETLAGQAAAAITGGWITEWAIRDATLHVTLDGIGGPMMPIQVLSFVASLDPHMPPEINHVKVMSANGLPLFDGSRLPADLFREPEDG